MANVFADIPDQLPEELFETLLNNPLFKLEWTDPDIETVWRVLHYSPGP